MIASPPAAEKLSRWITYREIAAQPRIWRDWLAPLQQHVAAVSDWFAPETYDEIWLCGAGTSAFIGEALAAHLNSAPAPLRYRAIATTDLVATPGAYLRPQARVLVVSFGRSGDSPETLGMLDLLDAQMPGADQLHFTCNPDGALAKRRAKGPGRRSVVILPAVTNDAGFAMTSSYSTMLLSALACLDPRIGTRLDRDLLATAKAAEAVIAALPDAVGDAVPSRVVFLGSGVLTPFAREAALKVLELTHGLVPAYWDSALGFRHGPKAILNDKARVFSFLSSDSHSRQYETDGADELRRQFGKTTLVTLGPKDSGADLTIDGPEANIWRGLPYVVAAQLLAVAWSDRLGFNVDNPFVDGNLSRVVSGVKLYAYEAAK